MDRLRLDDDFAGAVRAAAELVSAGGIVLFPTETFYGLATNPADELALQRLSSIKDRSATKPVPMIAANKEAALRLGPIPPVIARLCDAFWPGPLTVAIEPLASWSPILLGGGKSLGVRVSSHPFASALALAAGGLITSTSANPSSKPAPESVHAVDVILAGQVDMIIDAGTLQGGVPSTVVFARGADIVILRAGAISEADIARVHGHPLVVT